MPSMVATPLPVHLQNKRIGDSTPSDADQGHRQRLIVVGAGMAGFGVCDRLVRSGGIKRFSVTIIGEEPSPAYDRVNLSSYFSGRTATQLQLAPRHWYADNQIRLQTGCRVVKIDRTHQYVYDEQGREYSYDHLVLATGSRPYLPPIEGCDRKGVFVYRTISDLKRIREYCSTKQTNRASLVRGAVVGGGLLGLEAAKVLTDLGLAVSVIEMAPGLMPRQLQAEEAALLKERICELGVDVQVIRCTESIERDGDSLRVRFTNADPLDVDIVIVAAGVRPNDELARSANLEIAPRGGIIVDETLKTSDIKISAIGECVSFREHVYGLVAPCYKMADVLCQRFNGENQVFDGADESAELKLLGIQVATLGRQLADSPGGRLVSFREGKRFRNLLIERGRIVGATCVGEWEELPQVRQAIAKQVRLWPWQRRRFTLTGSPWLPGGAIPVNQWPADAIVCACLSVNKQQILETIESGNADIQSIAAQCGASTACGNCRSLVRQLAGAKATSESLLGANTLLAVSVLTIVLVLGWLVLPPFPVAETVQSSLHQWNKLLREDLGRQLTGFMLLGLTLLGLLFSLRKRWPRFQVLSYGFWRAAHGVLGTLVVFGIAIHTGLRLGSNLNLMLGVCFIGSAAIGGLVGIASGLESRTNGLLAMRLRHWRPRLAKFHLWVTWPLPVLIALHILSFYWFRD